MNLSEAIRDYGDYCRHEIGHTTSTYYSYISWQRNFAKWLDAQGQPDPNVREIGASLIRRFSYSLFARDLRPRTVRGALHAIRALFAFLHDHGLIETNPALDVRLPKKDAAVRQGKGMKARTVYLCEEVAAALKGWIDLRKTIPCTHDALFVVETKCRFGETPLAHIVEEVKAIAGMKDDPRIQPHSIRHAAATRLMRNGADLKSIQTWLGHTQLQTTAV